MTTIQQISLYVMAFIYAGAGINHFINPRFYLSIMPKFFPMQNLLNQVSGVAEIVLAIGLLFASTRQISAYLIIAMLVSFFAAFYACHSELVAPAMQVVLGGGVDVNGVGSVGDKIVKLPTKRTPEMLRIILNDYEANSTEGEYFNDYYRRQGKNYFYTILKPLANADLYVDDDFIDYDGVENFIPEIGVGECAGVMYDMVGGIIKDAENKLMNAKESLDKNKFPEAIYYAYTGFIIGAKALLLSKDVECNTQIKILKDFDTHLVTTGEFKIEDGFENLVLQINQHEPEKEFAENYVKQFDYFLKDVIAHRESSLNKDKVVVESSYKA